MTSLSHPDSVYSDQSLLCSAFLTLFLGVVHCLHGGLPSAQESPPVKELRSGFHSFLKPPKLRASCSAPRAILFRAA